ncbi:uroporphyrinogen-III decarboxylase-like protein, partial [Candidatus Bipolaricaulota bacterium]|nr:uroporphyrinogen-III decarboxylase-like protein [Candidatus Bipolaricaulota bacterium]
MAKMAGLVHQHDAYVFCHSDGAIRKIIPDLLEIGIDILNPIQWRSTGMDREKLSEDFGDEVVFHGGVDNQFTLPFGSPEQVREEVRENIKTLGKNGTYILAPCHNMQVNTPPENLAAMYEEGLKTGKR